MSRPIVFTFDTPEGAAQARAALKDLERSGALKLDDAVVVADDVAGKIHQHRDPSRAVLVGAVAGGLVGIPLFFVFPGIGVVFGAAVGGLIGRLVSGRRIDGDLVHDANGALRPGSSALLLLVGEGDVRALGDVLRCSGARLYETALSPELEVSLRQALVCPDALPGAAQEVPAGAS